MKKKTKTTIFPRGCFQISCQQNVNTILGIPATYHRKHKQENTKHTSKTLNALACAFSCVTKIQILSSHKFAKRVPPLHREDRSYSFPTSNFEPFEANYFPLKHGPQPYPLKALNQELQEQNTNATKNNTRKQKIEQREKNHCPLCCQRSPGGQRVERKKTQDPESSSWSFTDKLPTKHLILDLAGQ